MLIKVKLYICRLCQNVPYRCKCSCKCCCDLSCDKYLDFTVYCGLNHKTKQWIEMQFEPTVKVEKIKRRIEEVKGVPLHQQRLIFQGKQMSDDNTIQHYGLREGSELYLIYALPLRRHPVLVADRSSTSQETVNEEHDDAESIETVPSRIEDVAATGSTQQQPHKRRKVSSQMIDVGNVCKYEQFANYLAAELKELPSTTANELMDDITLKLLQVKRSVRSKNRKLH